MREREYPFGTQDAILRLMTVHESDQSIAEEWRDNQHHVSDHSTEGSRAEILYSTVKGHGAKRYLLVGSILLTAICMTAFDQ
jgi:hypothetical protein